MYVCVCMYVRTYVRTYVCMYVCVCVYVCMYIYRFLSLRSQAPSGTHGSYRVLGGSSTFSNMTRTSWASKVLWRSLSIEMAPMACPEASGTQGSHRVLGLAASGGGPLGLGTGIHIIGGGTGIPRSPSLSLQGPGGTAEAQKAGFRGSSRRLHPQGSELSQEG